MRHNVVQRGMTTMSSYTPTSMKSDYTGLPKLCIRYISLLRMSLEQDIEIATIPSAILREISNLYVLKT